MTINSEVPQRPPQPESLDEEWYSRFEPIGSFSVHEYLDGNKQYREKQKRRFLSGEIDNPKLDYPKIDLEELSEREVSLLQLKKDIIDQEENETVRRAYRWRINEKIAEVRMLRAASLGDMRRFGRYSEFVYGKPSLEIFYYTLNKLRETTSSQLFSSNPDIQEAAQGLLSLLPADLPEKKLDSSLGLPGETEVARARERTLIEMGRLIDIEAGEKGGKYSADEIRDIFQAALNNLQAEGWQVVVDTSSKSGISVDQEQREVKIPESRKVAFSKLRLLILHEVGTHVARRLNGERSRLHLLGLGLDRYERGEEGVATMREQVLADKVEDFTGLEGHLAIGLAAGLDGIPRDFSQVYIILEKYYYLKSLLSGREPKEALEEAQNNAWNRTVRTFRGTDCATRGTCFTKDIVYREGNIGVWGVIRDNPEELLRFSVGKYDPANLKHIWILNTLGISEADLEGLEN